MSFKDLLAASDVVVATCAVSAENQCLFNSEAFSCMKPSAVFINVTRGALVDQDALLQVGPAPCVVVAVLRLAYRCPEGLAALRRPGYPSRVACV